MPTDLQTQLIQDLVVESLEGLDQFDSEILALEKGMSGPDSLNTMFRVIHSLKGTSGCLGLGRIESLAHVGENLLSLLRDGKVEAKARTTATLLRYSDALRAMMQSLARNGDPGEADHSQLVADLQALANATDSSDAKAGSSGLFEDEVEPAPPAETVKPEEKIVATPRIVPSAPAAPRPSPNTPPHSNGIVETAIRVDVAQLDSLMDLVGELVLTRNQIVQSAGRLQEPALLASTQRLNLITTKLQANVMKTRMQPISNVWSKFPRIVRDLSRELGKQVNLVMEGQETELDRTIIEAVKDPLTHLVRNAIDHGLEAPSGRIAAGKPEEGVLRLRAFHESGNVNIEIRDDGAGIPRERVLQKALQKGLVRADQTARMTDREVFAFLFAPGFSTAEKVTNISGRGVGLDVVKKNVEKIGGSVDVQSVAGQSTTFRVKIPLTLAIIPALIIQCGASRYAIPQASLIELVLIESEQVSKAIEHVDSAPVYRLRGNLLPLVSLREQFRLPKPASTQESIYLLVLQAEGHQFGLIVDGIHDTEEIVVKPLGKELNGLSVFAGATIMGDGRVALILDVLGLARHTSVLENANRESAQERIADGHSAGSTGTRQSVLLFSVGGGQPAAIPLSHVARLEEFPTEDIERAANSEVVQYRGQIMPLVRVGQVLNRGGAEAEETIRVVVYNHRGVNVGLVVDRILDTVDDIFSIQRCNDRPGILGSGIVQKRVTDFLDADALIRASAVVNFTGAEGRS